MSDVKYVGHGYKQCRDRRGRFTKKQIPNYWTCVGPMVIGVGKTKKKAFEAMIRTQKRASSKDWWKANRAEYSSLDVTERIRNLLIECS